MNFEDSPHLVASLRSGGYHLLRGQVSDLYQVGSRWGYEEMLRSESFSHHEVEYSWNDAILKSKKR